MLIELRAERDQLAEAILVLERLAFGRGKRRGRPPAWMTAVKARKASGEQEPAERWLTGREATQMCILPARVASYNNPST
jgi:hypothetical protein